MVLNELDLNLFEHRGPDVSSYHDFKKNKVLLAHTISNY